MEKMPDIVLKRQRLSKTKTVVIFRRNNLSFNSFKKNVKGYTYQEEFYSHGMRGRLSIFVESENLYDLFKIDTKAAKVKGEEKSFGIFLRFPDQRYLPLVQSGAFGCMKFDLYCNGKNKSIYYVGKNKKPEKVGIYTNSNKTPVEIPKSVSWAALHPFQGGGFSPK